MAENAVRPSRLTVGSLLGLPLGAARDQPDRAAPRLPGTGGGSVVPAGAQEGEGWVVRGGEPRAGVAAAGYRPDGVEALDYNNPFGQTLERVWFDGKLVYAAELGEVDVDPGRVKVAQEYQVVYAVELDEQGKLRHEPQLVPGQYNIYDSVPGMDTYSPIWQFNYVIVPRGYRANTLRSEADCLSSGHPILHSNVFEN
jgi:hypothetical protein